MKVEWFEPGETPLWHTGIFGGYRISDVKSIDDLLAFRDERIAEWQNEACPLLIAGEVTQAVYQAGHVLECFEPHGDDVSASDYASHVLSGLERDVALLDIELLRATVGGIDEPGNGVDMSAWNRDPLSAFEEPVWMLKVPVSRQDEAFVGAPVGYFFYVKKPEGAATIEGHRGAVGVFRIIRYWQARGYELLGVGSLQVMFVRSTPLNEADARSIAKDVAWFKENPKAQEVEDLGSALCDKRVLIFSFLNQ